MLEVTVKVWGILVIFKHSEASGHMGEIALLCGF